MIYFLLGDGDGDRMSLLAINLTRNMRAVRPNYFGPVEKSAPLLPFRALSPILVAWQLR